MSVNTNQEQELNQDQVDARKAIMLKFYKDNIPLLKAQYEYEKLMADIEEARARRITMSVRIAQMMAGPQEEEESSIPNPPTPPAPSDPASNPTEPTMRKLKTE